MGAEIVSQSCRLGEERSFEPLRSVGRFPRQPFMWSLKDGELRGLLDGWKDTGNVSLPL